MALDLDGDGIETVGVGANPILFDHNSDGIKTGTGWLKGDDAWLVLDRDGNGAIDSGRELFGVDTQVTDASGQVRTAATGFEALRSLDDNGDGLFNSADAGFTQAQLWQDLNQDGVSQANELFKLADKGIVSISLNESTTTTNLGNGNSVTGTATVTRNNGTTTEIDSVEVTSESAGNLNLADNPFYREFTDQIPLTDVARGLPEMGGSGVLRDLREAMSLGTPQSEALVAAVQAYATAPTREQQLAKLDTLLHAWAATEASSSIQIEAAGSETRRFKVSGGTAAQEAHFSKIIPILEAFNGGTVDEAGWRSTTSVVNGRTIKTYTMASAQANLMQSSYDGLRESVYKGLLLQTRLEPYLDSIALKIDETGVSFDTTALVSNLQAAQISGDSNVLADLVDMNRYAYSTLNGLGFDAMKHLREWVDQIPGGSPLEAVLQQLGVLRGAQSQGGSAADIYVGDVAANTFRGGDGADLISGGEGNDWLYGDEGSDTLEGGVGNDTLNGGTGTANVYVFGKGDGQDVIVNVTDTTAGKQNTLRFKEGVQPSEVVARRVYDSGHESLELSIAGTTDKVLVRRFFYQDDPGNRYNAVQRIEFADGTAWDTAGIAQQVFKGTDAADTVRGTFGNDTITGGLGADTLGGAAGDDHIVGGEGNDWLYGDEGSDTLEGGVGNDTLHDSGTTSTEVYRFGRGDGADSLTDMGGSDRIEFGPDVTADQLWFASSGTSLQVSLIGTSDSVTINGWYSSDARKIETMQLSNGQTLASTQVQALVDAMAAFAPPAAGQTTLPENYQSSLNGVIAANWN